MPRYINPVNRRGRNMTPRMESTPVSTEVICTHNTSVYIGPAFPEPTATDTVYFCLLDHKP